MRLVTPYLEKRIFERIFSVFAFLTKSIPNDEKGSFTVIVSPSSRYSAFEKKPFVTAPQSAASAATSFIRETSYAEGGK